MWVHAVVSVSLVLQLCQRLELHKHQTLMSVVFSTVQDNIGVFVDQNGKLLQEGRICWSEPPGSVTIQVPYAIGRLPRHIEVW